MGLLRLAGFSGMWPIRDIRALPDNAAVEAINIFNDGGANLRGARQPLFLKDINALTRTVYRIPLPGPNTLLNSYWREFADENTDVHRAPILNDAFERFYWGNPTDGLRYAKKSEFISGFAGYLLGVPAPTTAPAITSITGGTGPIVTREYLVTFANQFGEEGQPSLIVEGDGNVDGTWNIGSIPQPPAPGSYTTFGSIKLYRTVTGETGVTDFYKVASLGVGVTTYADAVPDTNLSEPLQSTTWAIPPAGTQGLAAMPNGIFVTWKDNNLYFSENFRPHAWPAEYTLTVDFPIVGLAVFGNSLVVCTTGSPSIVSGVNAAAMTLQKIDAPLPCLSRRSITSAAEGVYYASEEGLVLVQAGGVQSVSRELISREQWRNEYAPSTQKAMYMGGEYIAARTVGGDPTDAFRFYPTNPSAYGVSKVDLPVVILNLGVEPWTGKPWFIGNDAKLYEWEAPGAAKLSYTWRSREFIYPYPANFAVFQAYFDESIGELLHLKIWATLRGNDRTTSRVLVYDADIEASGREIKLPSGFKSDVWQFEFSGVAQLQSFMIASTARELRGA